MKNTAPTKAISNVLTLALLVFAVGCKSTTAKKPNAGGASTAPQSGGGAGDASKNSGLTEDDKKKLEELMKQAQAAGASAAEAKKIAEEALAAAKANKKSEEKGGGNAKKESRTLTCDFEIDSKVPGIKLALDENGNLKSEKQESQSGTIVYSAKNNVIQFDYSSAGEKSKKATARIALSDKTKGAQEFDLVFGPKDSKQAKISCNESANEVKAEDEKYDENDQSLTRTAKYECGYADQLAKVQLNQTLDVLVSKDPSKSKKDELELNKKDPAVKLVANQTVGNGDVLLSVTSKSKSEVAIASLSNIQSMEIEAGKDFLGKDSAVKCVRSEKPVEKAGEKQNADAQNESEVDDGAGENADTAVQGQDQSE